MLMRVVLKAGATCNLATGPLLVRDEGIGHSYIFAIQQVRDGGATHVIVARFNMQRQRERHPFLPSSLHAVIPPADAEGGRKGE